MKGDCEMKTRFFLVSLLGAIVAVAPFSAASTIDATDPIIAITPAGNCSTSGTNNVCMNGSPFSLSSLLTGNVGLMTASLNGAGSWVVVNDTGSTITSLVLYYSGMLASNAPLNLQINGWSASAKPFANCSIITAASLVTNGCSNNTATPTALAAQLIWSTGTSGSGSVGLAPGQRFDITISSFAHAGQDVGCISGTRNCQPIPPPPPVIPEPNTVLLLGTGLVGVAVAGRQTYGRRKRKLTELPAGA